MQQIPQYPNEPWLNKCFVFLTMKLAGLFNGNKTSYISKDLISLIMTPLNGFLCGIKFSLADVWKSIKRMEL